MLYLLYWSVQLHHMLSALAAACHLVAPACALVQLQARARVCTTYQMRVCVRVQLRAGRRAHVCAAGIAQYGAHCSCRRVRRVRRAHVRNTQHVVYTACSVHCMWCTLQDLHKCGACRQHNERVGRHGNEKFNMNRFITGH